MYGFSNTYKVLYNLLKNMIKKKLYDFTLKYREINKL